MKEITLTINGADHTVELPEDMPLLWALRDRLNLVGTKFSCGIGICGSCTVLINGTPVEADPWRRTLDWTPDGAGPSRSAWLHVTHGVIGGFLLLGLVVLGAYMKVGYEHRELAGERYIPLATVVAGPSGTSP